MRRLPERGYPDRKCHGPVRTREFGVNRFLNLRYRSLCGLLPRAAKENGEFVTTNASDAVALACRLVQSFPNEPENCVSCVVAEGIVNGFEVIDVQISETETSAGPLGPIDFSGYQIMKASRVR